MTDQRWIVKERNFELDVVKYQVKLNPVLKDQDPLKVDLGNLDIIKKKKAQKKNIIVIILILILIMEVVEAKNLRLI